MLLSKHNKIGSVSENLFSVSDPLKILQIVIIYIFFKENEMNKTKKKDFLKFIPFLKLIE